MDITLLYFEDCPNWKLAEQRLAAMAKDRPDVRVIRALVRTPAEAERLGFLGSPSIQVDGVDVFAEPGSQVGLSCRRYWTPDGYQGAPSLEQLTGALTGA
ncbi:MAG: thioredoxin family protein [Ornithinimicrobium sp.]